MNMINVQTTPLAELIRMVGAPEVVLTDEQKALARDRLLQEWNVSKKVLEQAKANENALRVASVFLLSDPTKTKGTENVELGNGYKAKIVKKENWSFAKTEAGKVDTAAIYDACRKLSSEVGQIVVERIIEFKPEFKVGEFQKLTQAQQAILAPVLVVSAGTPTLEIVEPKVK